MDSPARYYIGYLIYHAFDFKYSGPIQRFRFATSHINCAFGSKLKNQFILLFSLFLQLFVGPIGIFGTIYEFHRTILVNFYLYLPYFQQKIFSFSKISRFQTNPKKMFVSLKKKIVLTPLRMK